MTSGIETQTTEESVNEVDESNEHNELPPGTEDDGSEIEDDLKDTEHKDEDDDDDEEDEENDELSNHDNTEPTKGAESNKQISSRQEMKEMLENRRNKKITKSLKKESEDSKFRNSLLQRMKVEDKIFNKQVTNLQKNMKELTGNMTKTFNLMAQMFAPGVPAPTVEGAPTIRPNAVPLNTMPLNAVPSNCIPPNQVPPSFQQYPTPPTDHYRIAAGSPDLSSSPVPRSSFSSGSGDESFESGEKDKGNGKTYFSLEF